MQYGVMENEDSRMRRRELELKRNLEAGKLAESVGIPACPQCGSTKRNGLLGGCDFPTNPWHKGESK